MKKLSLALLTGLWLSHLVGAETTLNAPRNLTTPNGHWAITRERPVDANKNGRIDPKEWKPSDSQRPWNRPQYLEGQTQRWNVKWEAGNAPTYGSQPLKL
ncbi:MAG: hypothetical protein J0I12_07815 [Candidatus Eremiobacteraeota bacterium]|nr:hypothetical protein [Candidatus Eremiobacteraeota bacterium]